MNHEQWNRIEEVFHTALERSPGDRYSYVESVCAGDAALRNEVLELLSHSREDSVSLRRPIAALSRELSEPTQTVVDVTRWGALELRGTLGEGGFGVVYRAWDPTLNKEVALKLLRHDRTGSREMSALIGEARRLARVRHPNVITVHGAEERNGIAGYWMELIRGVTLDRLVREQGAFGAREALLIGIELCQALAAVHTAGLVHSDVKPRNVMREEGGRYVLMDFGGAREPRRSSEPSLGIVGTPRFMAPEVLAGESPTPQTDLYSLGVLLFFVATGEYPVSGESPDDIRAAHRSGRRRRLRDVRPGLPVAFVQVVERALSPDPRSRFTTAGEMEAALLTTLAGVRGRVMPKRLAMWGGVLLAVVALVWAAGRVDRSADPTTTTVRRIAVLPMQNVGPADEQYIADGLTELLIAKLSEHRSLQVVSRTSAMQYRDPRQALPDIARALGAEAIVEGSVLKTGSRVRVSARLIQAGVDAQLWADSIERDFSELLILQSELALRIAGQLGAVSNDQDRLPRPAPVDIGAQDQFLRGASALRELNPDAVKTAARHFETAVTLAPDYARAWALLSHAYWYLASTAGPEDRPTMYQRTTAAAHRALELDAALPRAHVALAQTKFQFERDWAGAEAGFRHAIELDRSDPDAREKLGWLLAARASFDEALNQMRAARELDPMNDDRRSPYAAVLYYARRYDEAAAELTALIKARPTWLPARMGFARVQAARGLTAEALRELDAFQSRLGGLAEQARVQAAAGAQLEASRTLDTLLARREAGEYIAPEALAFVHIALGHRDEAYSLLEVAYRERSPGVLWLKVDPRFDPIRDEPRFVELVRRIGLE